MNAPEDDPAGRNELAQLTDEELEAELTIAAERSQRDARYTKLLAERERRRGVDPRD